MCWPESMPPGSSTPTPCSSASNGGYAHPSSSRPARTPHPVRGAVAVTLTPGKRGTVVLHAVPPTGADPLMEAAAGQLKEGSDPYRLVLPAERETLAEYYAEELRAAARPRRGPEPADRFLVAAPEAPLTSRRTTAGPPSTGPGSLPLVLDGRVHGEVEGGRPEFRGPAGVEWRSRSARRPSTAGAARLRARRRPGGRGGPGGKGGGSGGVVFGVGYGPVHESLVRRGGGGTRSAVRSNAPVSAMAAPAATRAPSPTASGSWASCTRRAWSPTRSSRPRRSARSLVGWRGYGGGRAGEAERRPGR